MSKQVDKFLDLLAERSLLPERTLAKLYRQVEDKKERGKSVPLDSLAKLLVDKGHLTQRQANSLINEVSQPGRSVEEEEIGLMPIDDEPRPRKVKPPPPPSEDPPAAEDNPYAEELTQDEVAALAEPKRKKRRQWEREGERDASPSRPVAGEDSPLDELSTASAALKERPARRRQKGGPRSEWESPLLLVGGGGLLLLVLVGALVWYLLRTDTGDAQLRIAREAYQDGAHSQAIEAYERFLDAHSDHDAVSAARVQLGLARLRRALESGANSDVVLEQAQTVIAETEQEPAFGEAGRELAAILERIAEGLAEQASQATDPETAQALSAKTEEALALLTNTKYVPRSIRPTETVEEIRRTLASVERRQQRQQALSSALERIAMAREEKSFQEAYGVYAELVRSYADVADLPEVRRAVTEIAQAEAAALQFQEEVRAASTDDRQAAASTGSVLLSTAIEAGAAERDAPTAFVRIEGAVYGMDAATGEPVWRRFVGHDDRLTPLATPAGDALVVDVQQGELLRLEGRTGKLVWRQTVGELAAGPVLQEGRALLPTADAKLLVVDVETGEAKGFVSFAQPLAASPTIDARANRVALVGERSIVYLLAADSLRGENAVFVGHASKSVTVPAAVFDDTLCVAENFAVNRSRLHVLTLGDGEAAGDSEAAGDGEASDAWKAIVEPIRLRGRVTTPMAVRERRLALATDLGEVRVFDVPSGGQGPPVSPVASRDASRDDSNDRYLVLRESELWLAGARLTRLRILATGGRLQSRDIPDSYDGDLFVHPPVVLGDRLVHVRRPQGRAGYLVAATSLQSGQSLWEHEVAVPPTDVSAVANGSRIAVSMANGRLYVGDISAGRGSGGRTIASAVFAPGGIGEMTVVGERIIVQDLGGDAGLRWIEGAQSQFNSGELPLPGRIAARPVALGEGLVVPLSIGQVFLIDVVHGEPIAAPFQPMIHPDRFPDWTAAAAADPPRSFAIADRGQRVYLLELEGDPPVLVPAAQSPDLPRPITGELCATPHAVFAAAGNRLLAYGLPDLAEREAVLFDERIVWGPYKAGDLVLLATADERLHCFAPDGRLLAEASLPAPAVGRPLAADDSSVILAAEDGTLLMADARVGTVAVLGTFGEPLAAGPIRLDGRLYAVTPDGVLVSLPSNLPATLAAASAQR